MAGPESEATSTLARWREAGEWWDGAAGLEVHQYLDAKGIRREAHRPLPPLSPEGEAKPYEENAREDWDLRVRKQRDMKVAKAMGTLPPAPVVYFRPARVEPYAALHVLSGYSFGRSTILAEEIAPLAAAQGIPAVAIADHLSLMGCVEHVRACRKCGIQSLVGATVELEDGSEIVLIARDKRGYRNLSTLLTEAHLDAERKFPLAYWDRLALHAEGLLCLTGGDAGPIDRRLVRRDMEGARRVLDHLIGLYGRDNVVLEVERSDLPWSMRVNRLMDELSAATGVLAVAGGPVTHARRDHFPAQDVLVCIETLCAIDEVVGRKPRRAPDQPPIPDVPLRALNAERFLHTPEEMAARFADRPDLLANTMRVVARCDPDVLPGRPPLPQLFPNEAEALRQITELGAMRRFAKYTPKHRRRLEMELDRIVRRGFAGHFLIAWDFCRWATEQGILLSGRGSVVDSAVAFCLGLSRIDAVEHRLHFDRFLPEDAEKRPDIDIDFEAHRREDVRQYMTRKYGVRHVATVAAVGAFCTRGIVREVGKVLGIPNESISALAKTIHGGVRPDTMESALDARPELRGSNIPRERFRWVFRLAQRLMDVPRNLRAHSSGVVVSAEPIEWTVPVTWGAQEGVPEEATDRAHLLRLIQWDKRSAKHFFDKFDVLCLRGQDVLSGTQRIVRQQEPGFCVEQIPLDDPETYRTMRSGQLIGIPQSASPAMRQAHIRIRTQDLRDASLVQAGIRPGVGGAVKLNELIARRRGKPYSFGHPKLEEILGETYGIIVFQEQVDQLLQAFAGYSSGEAEDIRDAIHKKRRDGYVESLRDEILGRIVARGFGHQVAHEVYELVSVFKGYGFAQGHALAFAEISVRSIYCQQNHPAPYFAALLNAQPAGYYGPATLVNEARSRGVPIHPPDVNLSEEDFTVEDALGGRLIVPFGAIRVGLRQISGLAKETRERIVAARMDGPFTTLHEFVRRTGPDRDELERLILCGALDELHPNRRALLWAIPDALTYAETWPLASSPGTLPLLPPPPPPIALVPDFTDGERALRERAILGLDVRSHLMAFERDRVRAKGGLTAQEAGTLPGGPRAFVVGHPIRLRFPPTQSGRRVLFFDLEDETGLLNVTCFDETYQRDGHTIVTSSYVTVVGEAQNRDGHIAVLAHRVHRYRPCLDAIKVPEGKPLVTADFLVG